MRLATRRNFLISTASASLLHAAGPHDDNDERVRIQSVPAGGIQPQLTLADGVLHLIYFGGDPKNGNIFYTQSNDFGASFSSTIRVNSQEGSAIAMGAVRGAQISLGKRKRVHVAWNGSDAAQPRGPINPEAGQPAAIIAPPGENLETAIV